MQFKLVHKILLDIFCVAQELEFVGLKTTFSSLVHFCCCHDHDSSSYPQNISAYFNDKYAKLFGFCLFGEGI